MSKEKIKEEYIELRKEGFSKDDAQEKIRKKYLGNYNYGFNKENKKEFKNILREKGLSKREAEASTKICNTQISKLQIDDGKICTEHSKYSKRFMRTILIFSIGLSLAIFIWLFFGLFEVLSGPSSNYPFAITISILLVVFPITIAIITNLFLRQDINKGVCVSKDVITEIEGIFNIRGGQLEKNIFLEKNKEKRVIDIF